MMPMGRERPDTDTLTNPRRWPFVAPLEARAPVGNAVGGGVVLTFNKGPRIINGFIEKDPEDGQYWIYKRPGFSTQKIGPLGNVNGYGIINLSNSVVGTIITIFGNGLYQNGFNVATIAGLKTPVNFQPIQFDNSNHANLLINASDASAWYYNSNTTTLTQITDPAFPVNRAGGWAYLDGFIYVMDITGRIYQSVNQNDPTTWSALDTINASSNPDAGIFLAKQLSYVVAFKQWTTQIFFDAGNPVGSSLSPVPDAQLPVGCLSGNTVQSLDDTLIWVATAQSASPKVMQMDNLIPKVVSTPSIERLLTHFAYTGISGFPFTVSAGVQSFSLKLGGHRFYGLSLNALNLCLVYDLDEKFWTLWTDVNGNMFPWIGSMYTLPGVSTPPGVFMQNLTGGYYQQLDVMDFYPTDGGTVFPVDIYTANYNGGSVRSKTLNAMYFETDVVPGSKLLTRFSDDDYNSWTQFREIDLAEVKPMIDNEGSFDYRRAYNLRHMGAQQFRIKAGYMQLDYGTL